MTGEPARLLEHVMDMQMEGGDYDEYSSRGETDWMGTQGPYWRRQPCVARACGRHGACRRATQRGRRDSA